MDKIYEFEEAEELARKAKNRLIVTKVAVEYLFIKDEYDKDRDHDLSDHLDPENPFELDLGGSG